ncbi:MAG: hypothetical protein R3234_03080 [Thermoanaerobaculia bacterium]|nr:hypothetical protein [Thermoanaerobaculia bacterium]
MQTRGRARGWCRLGIGILGSTVVLLLAAVSPLGAQEEICLGCHEVEVSSPMHRDFACSDCHTDVDLDVHPEPPIELSPTVVCGQCHEVSEGLEEGPHAQISCVDCHGEAHEILDPDELASPMSPVNQARACGECHGDDPENPDLIENYLASVHGHALFVSGLIEAPSCSDCHGGHDVFPSSNSRSSVSWENAPETCGSCHQLILDTWTTKSAHGFAWEEGDQEGPVCSTCHTAHSIKEPYQPQPRLEFPETCGDCHHESLHTFMDSFHGKASDLGFVTAAICSDCHTPHANLPAGDPRSSIHPDNLQETCGECHGAVSASFVSFDPHADPKDPEENPTLHWVYLFMHWLLIGVFAFFGVHDVLWLQRTAVGAWRGELDRIPRTEGPWIRRFRRGQVGLHATVIVSFLLLAATGLPLRFHVADWAQALSDVFGGVAASRALHRLAALVTFGYFLYHLIDLVRRAVVKNESGLLWGADSMVPRPKDLRDLWNNLRYFLYLGRRPRHDRWTYWEKFDYFAVFWGVVIIGSSGLALWFPRLFTAVFPGWMLNVAYVIHSDEALLATGFIFVFHFFHTHLRPEAFPLDPSIFVGKIPVERLKEERPEEYRRLSESGELEDLLVPPPTKRQLRRAYVLGGLALAIGLALVVGILVGITMY